MGYQAQLIVARDTYLEESQILSDEIDNRLKLIKQHTEDIATEYRNSFEAYKAYIIAMNAASSQILGIVPEILKGGTAGGGEIMGPFAQILGEGQHGIPFVPRTGLYKLHREETVSTPRQASGGGAGGHVTIDLTGNLNVNLVKTLGETDDPESWVANKIQRGVRRGLIKTPISTIYE